jgi:hypothetical protein
MKVVALYYIFCNLRAWMAFRLRALMKTRITLPENGRGEKRTVIVTVEFGKERMTIEVIVAAEFDENEVRKSAIARARDFARKFALDAV